MNGKRLSLAAVISLSVLTLWGLVGCSKNNSSTYASDGTLTATVNGTAFSAKSYVLAGYLSAYGQLIVQGDSITNSKDTTEIQLAMPYVPAVNSPIYTDSTQYAGITFIMPGKRYDAYYHLSFSHAVITVTTADTTSHHIAGTFSGVLYNDTNSNDSINITNGVFNSSYSEQ